MRVLNGSGALPLVLGLALAGSGCGEEPKGQDPIDPSAFPSTYRDTQDNQVVVQVEGLR